MPYTHLTQEDRVTLGALWRAGHHRAFIAKQLGKHPSTISREMRRNYVPNKSGYDATVARLFTQARRQRINEQFRKLEGEAHLRRYVVRKLKQYWSPEQIAGRLRRDGIVICHETIYQFVYRNPSLKPFLRFKATKYRRRRGTHKRAAAREAAKKRWIDVRPVEVNERRRVGDWEGDTMEGKRSCGGLVLTHVERKSGYLLGDKLEGKSPFEVKDAAAARLQKIPRSKRHTVTYDNGTEFTFHEFIERQTKATVFFAHPYSSWERGTCENTIGLLRQFFPKKTNLSLVTQKQIDRAVRLLNTRPRKRLQYRTPAEVFCCTKS